MIHYGSGTLSLPEASRPSTVIAVSSPESHVRSYHSSSVIKLRQGRVSHLSL